MNSEHLDDEMPLLDGLGNVPREAFARMQAPPELRDAVWRATAGNVRRRTRRRRAVTLCGVLIAYAAGFGSFWAVMRQTAEPPTVIAQQEGQQTVNLQQRHAPPETIATEFASPRPAAIPKTVPASTQLPRDPVALAERIAEAPKEERAKLFVQAGDRYLNETGDIKVATQCYRRALKLMDTAERTGITSRDTWLLASLKQASLEQTAHSKQNHMQETSDENDRT